MRITKTIKWGFPIKTEERNNGDLYCFIHHYNGYTQISLSTTAILWNVILNQQRMYYLVSNTKYLN